MALFFWVQMKLSTDRLSFRKFTYSDFDLLYGLDTSPQVMEYINGGKPLNQNEVQKALSNIIQRYNDWKGLGVFAAHIKATGDFVGWFALKPVPNIDEIEVGYRLLPKYWNRGFATEGTRKFVEYGFETMSLDKIMAIAMPENKASRRVLIKSGLIQMGLIDNPFEMVEAKKVAYYQIFKNDYFKLKSLDD